MTERKPPGMGFESWVDRQIREAMERGDFDNLPGAGKPIPGRGQPDDELWWVKNYIRREELSAEALLPTPLRLRREVELLPETVKALRSEQAVREAVEELNRRIADWLRVPIGPRVHVTPVDADDVVRRWRADREAGVPHRAPGTPSPRPSAHPAQKRRAGWWRRRKSG